MQPANGDLRSFRDQVRRGEVDDGTLAEGRELIKRLASEPDSKDYLQALSLAAEAAEQLGQYEEMNEIVADRAKVLKSRLDQESISSRVRYSTNQAQHDYEIVRQEIWCLLAYARSCQYLRNTSEATNILELIQRQVGAAIELPGWPKQLQFRGTRARLHYYLGIVLRRTRPRRAFRHFRMALDFVWERWEQQRKDHKNEPARFRVEYQYAIDCVARVLSYGQAWTLLSQARLNEAASILRGASLLARIGDNHHLHKSISLLLYHVERHEAGYLPAKLLPILGELENLTKEFVDHPINRSRARFERGLVLIALLRNRDPTCASLRMEHQKKLGAVINELNDKDRPVDPELVKERDFQVHWLRALQLEADGRHLIADDPVAARKNFERARFELRRVLNLYRALAEPSAISPLQDWDAQMWVMPAAVEIQLGNGKAAEKLLEDGKEPWVRGPFWLQALANARYAAAAALRGEFAKGEEAIELAARLLRERADELPWVSEEIQYVKEFVWEKKHARDLVLNSVKSTAKPLDGALDLVRAILQSEFEEQHRIQKSRNKRMRPNSWWQVSAAAALGCTEDELDTWLSLCRLEYERQPGRPPDALTQRPSKKL